MTRAWRPATRAALWRRASIAALLVSVACDAAHGAAGQGETVVLASGADLESANPLVTVHPMARQVQRHALFVTLARYDSSLVAQPYFARAWAWSADRRTITLSLVPNLRWHDGVRTTARDVAFTLAAARDPATGSPRAGELQWLAGVDVVDDTTLALRAVHPLPEFPGVLCELPLVPAHRLSGVPRAELRRHEFATAPVGNGPFVFVERRPGQRWIFRRNPDFPAAMGGPPRVDRLVVAVVDEATTKFAALVSGDVDAAGISPTMASLVARDPSLAVLSYPLLFSYALVFNPTRAPFDDVRVRHAVSLAIDRARIVEVALAGFGSPATGAIPPDHPWAVTPAADTRARAERADPAAAARLLDDAGWSVAPDGIRQRAGVPLRFTVLTVGSGDNALEQLLQADLRRVGIDVAIQQREAGAFLAQARSEVKRFDALVTGVPGDLALGHLSAMFDGAQARGALDYTGRHVPALDSAFAVARRASDATALRAAWAEVQRLLAGDAPVAWLYHARGVQGIRRRVHGVRMDMRGELATIARWTKEPPP